MSAPRGRGYAIRSAAKNSPVTELRRPGEAGLKLRFGEGSQPSSQASKIPETTEDECTRICDKIGQMNMSDANNTLSVCAEDVKSFCDSPEKLEEFTTSIVGFATKSKWNAHAVAVFCDSHGDIAVDQVKLRTLLLRKLQSFYKERNKAYLELDTFLLDAAFSCEIFHHVRIEGNCLKILARPILDYLGMLVDGASQKEVEVFVEQFPKCYKNLKENDPDGLETLLTKIRKQIVSESTKVAVKAMLLETFESVLTDWKPIHQTAKYLYASLSKPIARFCD